MRTTLTIDWTLTIAVYAAVVATMAILWDAYKWKHAGPKLLLRLNTGIQSINMPEHEGKTLMMVTATNRGDRPTTITHFSIHHYDSWWSYVRRQAVYNAVVNTWGLSVQPTPYVLAPGAVWTGLADQTKDVERMAKKGRLYVSVTHSHSKDAILMRVLFRVHQTTEPKCSD